MIDVGMGGYVDASIREEHGVNNVTSGPGQKFEWTKVRVKQNLYIFSKINLSKTVNEITILSIIIHHIIFSLMEIKK